MKLSLNIDGKIHELDIDPRKRLLDVLRDDLGKTGVKEGCGEGECGACSVLVDGRLANSCIVSAGQLGQAEVKTIEGFRETARYKVIEAGFLEAGAVQCGFCIPGMIMSAEALLSRNPDPTDEEIRTGISGNLCRCTGYNMIVEAIRLASVKGRGLW